MIEHDKNCPECYSGKEETNKFLDIIGVLSLILITIYYVVTYAL